MLLDAARDGGFVETVESEHVPAKARVVPIRLAEWTVVIPFFYERDVLGETLASLAAQTRSFKLVLVDNGSTDGSAKVAIDACVALGLDWTLLDERRPGKVFALTTGLEAVRSPLIATCDADTWYPPEYLAEAEVLLAAHQHHACAVAPPVPYRWCRPGVPHRGAAPRRRVRCDTLELCVGGSRDHPPRAPRRQHEIRRALLVRPVAAPAQPRVAPLDARGAHPLSRAGAGRGRLVLLPLSGRSARPSPHDQRAHPRASLPGPEDRRCAGCYYVLTTSRSRPRSARSLPGSPRAES